MDADKCFKTGLWGSIFAAICCFTPILVVGLAVIVTGWLMMPRIRTPLFERDPYLMSDVAWGYTYVLHGLAGIALVGLVIAHVYFAVRPEKWWITKAMLVGWITRRTDPCFHGLPAKHS